MRALRMFILILFVVASTLTASPAQADQGVDLGLEVLPANDGWAAFGPGVTGGSAAAPEQVYTVTNRQELVAALYDGVYPPTSLSNPSNSPKIIYISGVIDANVDDNNNPLTCEDYFRSGFTWEAFLAAYDPAVWGRDVEPFGPLEDARDDSQDQQEARVRIRVGDNTTIVGLGKDATLRGAWLDLRKPTSSAPDRKNIIIRNITFEDTYDCFPVWDPTDGELGSWNALYDSISLRNTVNVWIDHNTFRDRETLDSRAPMYFGVLFQQHDGLVDITNASNYVTVSWNRFENHDKVMLIGSSDNAPADVNKLKVTLHHNLFDGTGQRTPRVRYGQVHLYNNYYKVINNPAYVYAWGVGKLSQIYAENNYITTDQAIGPADLIGVYNGTMIYATGTFMNGTPGGNPIDVVAEFNFFYDPDLVPTVDWTPTFFTEVDPTLRVVPLVESKAGPFLFRRTEP